MAGKRVHVKLEDFLRVTVAQRNEYTTKALASEALGMTFLSFGAKMVEMRKRYPTIYADVAHYEKGPSVASENEALAILAGLTASLESELEGEQESELEDE